MKGRDNPEPGRSATKVQLRIPFEGQPSEEIKVSAYVFDRSGVLLATAPVERGQVQLSLSPQQARGARIFLGPPLPEGQKPEEATLQMMERIRAYEPLWRFDPRRDVYDLLPIPELHWEFWKWCYCRVRGQVVKPMTINGTTVEAPLCHLRVHICEVDRWPRIILRLPDDIILRIRDELIHELMRPIPRPIPEPDPPPFRFDPGVIDPSPERLAELNGARPSHLSHVALNPQPLPPREFESGLSRVSLNPQPEPPLPELRTFVSPESIVGFDPQPDPPGRFPGMNLEMRAALASSSAASLRQTFIENQQLILPYLCGWPWLWWWYTCDELAVVETDQFGRFDTAIWYLCSGDHPDLYFWIEAFVGGAWTTVYHPPIACNTYWNYACSSEVTLRVTDPRVVPCGDPPDLPGMQVAVMTIGNNVSLAEIQGAASGGNEGLTSAGEPFGAVLEPRVWFGRSALFAAGITHYRWSYRQITAADGVTPVSDGWHPMNRTVVRHYAVIDPTPPDFPLSFPAYVLGPDPAFPGQDLFQIQPIDPPTGSEGWAVVDAHEDLPSAFFQTHLLQGGDAEAGAGKYELKLELFRNDGTLVNLTDAGVQLKVPTVPAPFGTGTVPTALAAAEHLVLDAGGKVIAFRLVLRVDNAPCQAVIYPVSGPGLTMGECGFILYPPSAQAHVSFLARHPRNFATFSFTIHRGASIFIPEAYAAGSVGATPINGYVRNAASVFAKDIAVNTLLTSNTPPGHTPCTKGAFAENLYVAALATDGWYRLYYLDASGVPVAFALEPAGP